LEDINPPGDGSQAANWQPYWNDKQTNGAGSTDSKEKSSKHWLVIGFAKKFLQHFRAQDFYPA